MNFFTDETALAARTGDDRVVEAQELGELQLALIGGGNVIITLG